MSASVQGGSADLPGFDSYLVLEKPVPRSQTRISLSNEFQAALLGKDDHDRIFATWNERLKKNNLLFDGLKFRLGSASGTNNSSGVFEAHVNLGLTSYARYLGTNRNADEAFVLDLMERGKSIFGNASAYLADPLGNAGLVITNDGYIPLIRRSFRTAEFAGWFDVPGGHPEPHRIGIKEFNQDFEVAEKDLVDEFFDSVADEVNTELNLPRDKLSDPLFFGIVRAHASKGRPSAAFMIKVNMTADEVETAYRKGGTEAYESTALVLVPVLVAQRGFGEIRCGIGGHDKDAGDLPTPQHFQDLNLVPSAGFCFEILRAMHLEALPQ